jgi:hypothetical protein
MTSEGFCEAAWVAVAQKSFAWGDCATRFTDFVVSGDGQKASGSCFSQSENHISNT